MIYSQEEFYYFVHDYLDYITLRLDDLVSLVFTLLFVAVGACLYYLFWRRR